MKRATRFFFSAQVSATHSGEYSASGNRIDRTGRSLVNASSATGGLVRLSARWTMFSLASLGPSTSTAVGSTSSRNLPRWNAPIGDRCRTPKIRQSGPCDGTAYVLREAMARSPALT